MTIKVEKNFIVSKEAKEKIINKNIKKIYKKIKKIEENNRVTKLLKQKAIKGCEKNIEDIEYIEAFALLVLLGNDFSRIEKNMIENQKEEQLLLKNEQYWNNPSMDHCIFFLYTFLYESYKHYALDHMNYFNKLNQQEMLKNLKDY